MKKCIVIGANGFIGRHIENYLKHKHNIIATSYDMVPQANLPNYHCLDFTDRKELERVDLNVDYVFMFAGLTGTHAGFEAYARYVETNEITLLNLLDAIKKTPYRPKVIFPST